MGLPLIQQDILKPVITILTDYPRDDLASDEVRQALVTSCAMEKLECFSIDVAAIPGMNTVVAGFKSAQLACNSQMGFGHVFLTNCAPRKNIISSRSKGEGVVIGILPNGATVLTVDSGYALAPFANMIRSGQAHFFYSDIPDEGSQFRSRDYFPAASVKLASYIRDAARTVGPTTIKEKLAAGKHADLIADFPLLREKLTIDDVTEMQQGAIWYIDNFGNIKLNLVHEELLKHHAVGTNLIMSVGDSIADAIIGKAGFSQGEGILALTRGSSGWNEGGAEDIRFTEIFLRGSSAANLLQDAAPGEQLFILAKEDLVKAQKMLRDGGVQYIGAHNLFMMSEARLIHMFAHYRLIKNGIDSRHLQKRLDDGSLVDFLLAKAQDSEQDAA